MGVEYIDFDDSNSDSFENSDIVHQSTHQSDVNIESSKIVVSSGNFSVTIDATSLDFNILYKKWVDCINFVCLHNKTPNVYTNKHLYYLNSSIKHTISRLNNYEGVLLFSHVIHTNRNDEEFLDSLYVLIVQWYFCIKYNFRISEFSFLGCFSTLNNLILGLRSVSYSFSRFVIKLFKDYAELERYIYPIMGHRSYTDGSDDPNLFENRFIEMYPIFSNFCFSFNLKSFSEEFVSYIFDLNFSMSRKNIPFNYDDFYLVLEDLWNYLNVDASEYKELSQMKVYLMLLDIYSDISFNIGVKDTEMNNFVEQITEVYSKWLKLMESNRSKFKDVSNGLNVNSESVSVKRENSQNLLGDTYKSNEKLIDQFKGHVVLSYSKFIEYYFNSVGNKDENNNNDNKENKKQERETKEDEKVKEDNNKENTNNKHLQSLYTKIIEVTHGLLKYGGNEEMNVCKDLMVLVRNNSNENVDTRVTLQGSSLRVGNFTNNKENKRNNNKQENKEKENKERGNNREKINDDNNKEKKEENKKEENEKEKEDELKFKYYKCEESFETKGVSFTIKSSYEKVCEFCGRVYSAIGRESGFDRDLEGFKIHFSTTLTSNIEDSYTYYDFPQELAKEFLVELSKAADKKRSSVSSILIDNENNKTNKYNNQNNKENKRNNTENKEKEGKDKRNEEYNKENMKNKNSAMYCSVMAIASLMGDDVYLDCSVDKMVRVVVNYRSVYGYDVEVFELIFKLLYLEISDDCVMAMEYRNYELSMYRTMLLRYLLQLCLSPINTPLEVKLDLRRSVDFRAFVVRLFKYLNFRTNYLLMDRVVFEKYMTTRVLRYNKNKENKNKEENKRNKYNKIKEYNKENKKNNKEKEKEEKNKKEKIIKIKEGKKEKTNEKNNIKEETDEDEYDYIENEQYYNEEEYDSFEEYLRMELDGEYMSEEEEEYENEYEYYKANNNRNNKENKNKEEKEENKRNKYNNIKEEYIYNEQYEEEETEEDSEEETDEDDEEEDVDSRLEEVPMDDVMSSFGFLEYHGRENSSGIIKINVKSEDSPKNEVFFDQEYFFNLFFKFYGVLRYFRDFGKSFGSEVLDQFSFKYYLRLCSNDFYDAYNTSIIYSTIRRVLDTNEYGQKTDNAVFVRYFGESEGKNGEYMSEEEEEYEEEYEYYKANNNRNNKENKNKEEKEENKRNKYNNIKEDKNKEEKENKGNKRKNNKKGKGNNLINVPMINLLKLNNRYTKRSFYSLTYMFCSEFFRYVPLSGVSTLLCIWASSLPTDSTSTVKNQKIATARYVVFMLISRICAVETDMSEEMFSSLETLVSAVNVIFVNLEIIYRQPSVNPMCEVISSDDEFSTPKPCDILSQDILDTDDMSGCDSEFYDKLVNNYKAIKTANIKKYCEKRNTIRDKNKQEVQLLLQVSSLLAQILESISNKLYKIVSDPENGFLSQSSDALMVSCVGVKRTLFNSVMDFLDLVDNTISATIRTCILSTLNLTDEELVDDLNLKSNNFEYYKDYNDKDNNNEKKEKENKEDKETEIKEEKNEKENKDNVKQEEQERETKENERVKEDKEQYDKDNYGMNIVSVKSEPSEYSTPVHSKSQLMNNLSQLSYLNKENEYNNIKEDKNKEEKENKERNKKENKENNTPKTPKRMNGNSIYSEIIAKIKSHKNNIKYRLNLLSKIPYPEETTSSPKEIYLWDSAEGMESVFYDVDEMPQESLEDDLDDFIDFDTDKHLSMLTYDSDNNNIKNRKAYNVNKKLKLTNLRNEWKFIIKSHLI